MNAALRQMVPDRIDELILRCEADAGLHITGDGNAEDELSGIEARLGHRLPAPYRAFLGRLGGGVYYMRHEIFGARRVMTHDIELVPDVLSFAQWLGGTVPAGWLPIHRSAEGVHVIRLGVSDPAPVRALGGVGTTYADFTSFLDVLLLTR